MTTQKRAKPGANRLALAVDNSEGLNLSDSGAKKSRAQILKQALSIQGNNWQAKLAHDFELKRYTFDARLKNVGNYKTLPFDGQSSKLGDALTTLTRRYQGQPLAGIVVFTWTKGVNNVLAAVHTSNALESFRQGLSLIHI